MQEIECFQGVEGVLRFSLMRRAEMHVYIHCPNERGLKTAEWILG